MAKAKKAAAWKAPADLKKEFNKQKKEQLGSRNLDDDIVDEGEYTARLTSANAGTFSRNGAVVPYIGYNFVVSEGSDAEGAKLSILDTFDNGRPASIRFALSTLQRLDVKTDDLDPAKLPDELKAAAIQLATEKPAVRLNVKHKEGTGKSAGQGPVDGLFQNVYVNGLV
jgi:hypothetical protein